MSSGNKCPFLIVQSQTDRNDFSYSGVKKKNLLGILCFIISSLKKKNKPTSTYFGFRQLKAFNLHNQNQSSLLGRYNADMEGSKLLQTYELLHPFVPKYYFLKTNLHLLARSSSKASDHSWASSGEGLQKEGEHQTTLLKLYRF